MIGSVIDKYEVLQKLGEGATATVYRGRHLAIGKEVAIKILHPHLSASSRNRERFNREARAVGRLSHQNIVNILDYSGQAGDDCYIVTELVDGVTLQTMLEDQGRLPSELAEMLGADLCAALAFAHAQGIIHRDIKPENVMIRRDGRVKLMDFGVARVLDEGHITLDGSLLGSPAYMSPQQALDEPLDGRSDMFSLGTVLFHAVTGRTPFAGTNASVILRNIIDGNRSEVLELAPDVSPGLAGVIDRLLQPKADDRYADATLCRAALLAALADLDLSPEHSAINLRTYLVTPKDCTDALGAHLRAKLLEKGKSRLAVGDHLGALQLFNRLLSIDDDQPEVMELIQSLHQPVPQRKRPRWVTPVIVATCFAGLASAILLTMQLSVEAPALAPLAEATPTPTPATPLAARPAVSPRSPLLPPPGAALTASKPPRSKTPTSSAAAAARLLPPTPPPSKTARVVLSNPRHTVLEIRVDGKTIGYSRSSKPYETWIGTPERPIELPAGPHKLELLNEGADPQVVALQLYEGELKTVDVNLRHLPVTFIVKSVLPRDCKLTIGDFQYGVISGVAGNPEATDPAANTVIRYECPPPINTFEEKLGPTSPGKPVFLPLRQPPGLPLTPPPGLP